VVLTTTNGTGSNTTTKAGYIEVVEPSPNPLVQGFEGILSLPQLWTIEDNGGLRTWQLATNARSEGQNSMKVNNFEARNAGERTRLISNPFSMQNMLTADLSFDYSYKKFSGLTAEGLSVHISTDCGNTWTMIWEKRGAYLATVAGNATSAEWVPTLPSHWLGDTINIDSFAGAPSVKVAFEVETGNGQAIYIDRINIGGTFVGIKDEIALNWDFAVAPNPFSSSFELRYDLQQATSLEFSLTDLSGRTLRTVSTGTKAAGRHTMVFSDEVLSELPAGVYFLKGQSAQGSITRKLVKLN
jgi:PKD repeat protein